MLNWAVEKPKEVPNSSICCGPKYWAMRLNNWACASGLVSSFAIELMVFCFEPDCAPAPKSVPVIGVPLRLACMRRERSCWSCGGFWGWGWGCLWGWGFIALVYKS